MLWTEWINRLRYLTRRSRFDAEMDQEVQFHIDNRIGELVEDGLSRSEALLQAQREFGPTARMQEDTRAAWEVRWIEELGADLRYAGRTFLRDPGFVVAAVLSLALGIGANTTIFSVVKAALLGSLPVSAPDRLVSFHQPSGLVTLSYPDFVDYRDQTDVFAGVAATYPVVPASIRASGEPERVWGQLVTTNYFSVLGAEPHLGRGFRDEDNTSPVVVISEGLWSRNFGGDPGIVGKAVVLGGATYTVAGVAPPGFHGNV
jgi:hypothetical protein